MFSDDALADLARLGDDGLVSRQLGVHTLPRGETPITLEATRRALDATKTTDHIFHIQSNSDKRNNRI